MPLGRLSARIDSRTPLHHLWRNNGTWWIHYTLHFDFRKRRIRRSLSTRSLPEAIRRRDELLARLSIEGEPVPERTTRPAPAAPLALTIRLLTPVACPTA